MQLGGLEDFFGSVVVTVDDNLDDEAAIHAVALLQFLDTQHDQPQLTLEFIEGLLHGVSAINSDDDLGGFLPHHCYGIKPHEEGQIVLGRLSHVLHTSLGLIVIGEALC